MRKSVQEKTEAQIKDLKERWRLMRRPAWTISFFLLWFALVPGALTVHIAVGILIPAISNMPDNMVKGFDSVFKFAYMEEDSKNIKAACADAVALCDVTDADATCPDWEPPSYTEEELKNDESKRKEVEAGKANKNVEEPRDKIVAAFTSSLGVVKRVATDKYFGTADMASTATQLGEIVTQMEELKTSMPCFGAVAAFCKIHQSADQIVKGMDMVNKAISAFKESDIIKKFDEHKGILTFLHVMPYFLAGSLFFFGLFWMRGGVMCCCRDGTFCGTLALVPAMVLWLVSFIIFVVVLAAGMAMKTQANKIPVPVLRGEPNLEDVIEHIQTEYPEFWKVVFKDLESGLSGLLTSSYIFIAVALLSWLYMTCECLCCPYRKPKEKGFQEGVLETE